MEKFAQKSYRKCRGICLSEMENEKETELNAESVCVKIENRKVCAKKLQKMSWYLFK